ncbi:hypothetical protein HYV11_00485 [Candidatus Dependentiae bacterium]|nr:hypothetical protein [Candidatus Dependentiae bacterium]
MDEAILQEKKNEEILANIERTLLEKHHLEQMQAIKKEEELVRKEIEQLKMSENDAVIFFQRRK